ncbi:MAG: transglycosylase SLT domain-containing protein, partial [Leptospiraceae bacterium]|nr:transglycosylase SLT domain-containing protein [Leptospiraceae bacterium]
HPNLDVSTPISFPQRVAWLVRPEATELRLRLNEWILKIKENGVLDALYARYFKQSRIAGERMRSGFHSLTGKSISAYDDLLKKASKDAGFDWRLLAAVAYQESRFNPRAKSWAGATGLMQVMPYTASGYGYRNLYDPVENVRISGLYFQSVEKHLAKYELDESEKIHFMLASYNAGPGHVEDAMRLAEKYGKNPKIWFNNVDEFILNLANPVYYNDPIVKYGYCRGEEPYLYVKQIMERFEHYKRFIDE